MVETKAITWCQYCGESLPPARLALGPYYCDDEHRRLDRVEALRPIIPRRVSNPHPSDPSIAHLPAPVQLLISLRRIRKALYAKLSAKRKLKLTRRFISAGWIGSNGRLA